MIACLLACDDEVEVAGEEQEEEEEGFAVGATVMPFWVHLCIVVAC